MIVDFNPEALVLHDEQGTKKSFMEAQARPNTTPMVWGTTEDDTIWGMVEVLAQGQKTHSRKRLLTNSYRDTALATLLGANGAPMLAPDG